MQNGKYRITVTSDKKPSTNTEIVIYNPYYGCYGYDIENDCIELVWVERSNGTYIAEFEIITDYEKNYVMLGDGSMINFDKWNNYNIEIVRYGDAEKIKSSEQIVGW